MESGISMVFHSIIISFILYIIMTFLLKQSPSKAQDRSILVGAIVLIYMILFGHGMSRRINSNIF